MLRDSRTLENTSLRAVMSCSQMEAALQMQVSEPETEEETPLPNTATRDRGLGRKSRLWVWRVLEDFVSREHGV